MDKLHECKRARLGRHVEHLVLGRRARRQRPVQIVLIQLAEVLSIGHRVSVCSDRLDFTAESGDVCDCARELGNCNGCMLATGKQHIQADLHQDAIVVKRVKRRRKKRCVSGKKEACD